MELGKTQQTGPGTNREASGGPQRGRFLPAFFDESNLQMKTRACEIDGVWLGGHAGKIGFAINSDGVSVIRRSDKTIIFQLTHRQAKRFSEQLKSRLSEYHDEAKFHERARREVQAEERESIEKGKGTEKIKVSER